MSPRAAAMRSIAVWIGMISGATVEDELASDAGFTNHGEIGTGVVLTVFDQGLDAPPRWVLTRK